MDIVVSDRRPRPIQKRLAPTARHSYRVLDENTGRPVVDTETDAVLNFATWDSAETYTAFRGGDVVSLVSK